MQGLDGAYIVFFLICLWTSAIVWTEKVEAEWGTFTQQSETVKSELSGQREKQGAAMVEILGGATPEQIAQEPILSFSGPLPGRKLYCRIDRENTIMNTTYR